MARKSVLELKEAFEGLKFSGLSTNRALSEKETYKIFCRYKSHYITIFIFWKNIFYFKQNHSTLFDPEKFTEINNNKLRVLNDF